MIDHRLYAPATLRNRDVILDVLRGVLPTTGVVLEVASGSGASRRGRATEASSAGQDRLLAPGHVAASPQRKGAWVFHIACRTTASLRATATRAFLNPAARASRRPRP